jgi:hypothetical protein
VVFSSLYAVELFAGHVVVKLPLPWLLLCCTAEHALFPGYMTTQEGVCGCRGSEALPHGHCAITCRRRSVATSLSQVSMAVLTASEFGYSRSCESQIVGLGYCTCKNTMQAEQKSTQCLTLAK